MEATGMVLLPGWFSSRAPAAPGRTAHTERHPRHGRSAGESGRLGPKCSEGLFEVRRQRGADVHRPAGDRMREGEPGGVQELPLEAEVAGPAVQRIAGHGKVDGGEVD